MVLRQLAAVSSCLRRTTGAVGGAAIHRNRFKASAKRFTARHAGHYETEDKECRDNAHVLEDIRVPQSGQETHGLLVSPPPITLPRLSAPTKRAPATVPRRSRTDRHYARSSADQSNRRSVRFSPKAAWFLLPFLPSPTASSDAASSQQKSSATL